MTNNLLFNPVVNKSLAMLDDSKSMASIAIRDGLDTSGRTVMEYQRDKHGGRERLIEEALTLVLWGFGISFMKNRVYDPLVKRFTSGPNKIEHPDLDIDLFAHPPKQGAASTYKGFVSKTAQRVKNALNMDILPGSGESFQRLDGNLTQKLKGTLGKQNPEYAKYCDSISNIINSPKLQTWYKGSGTAKFLIATGIPVFLIAFGIPTFNQWLTRRKLSEEQKGQPGNTAKNQPVGVVAAKTSNTTFRQPSHFSAFEAARTGNVPAMSQPANPFAGMVANAAPPVGANNARPVQFAGIGSALTSGMSTLLQNDRYNTLLVDNIISGGRVYKARNWNERAEIAFREGSIIFFLYWAQGILQKAFSRGIDSALGCKTDLDFSANQYLYTQYKDKTAAFQSDYQDALRYFKDKLGDNAIAEMADVQQKLHGKGIFDGWKLFKDPNTVAQLQMREQALNKKLVQTIQEYFVEQAAGHAPTNLFMETAKASNWIPTWTPSATTSATQKSLTEKLSSTWRSWTTLEKVETSKFLDLTKKIDTEPIWKLVHTLEDAVEKDFIKMKGPIQDSLQNTLKRAMSGRAAAWFSANLVCAFFLSYICPKIQHYITYKRTGKDFFPGVTSN